MTIYGRNNRQDELIGFLDAQKPAFQDDTLVLGNLYFYTGVVQYEMDDKANSRANFEKARELFREVYDESNSIFDTINSYLE